MRPHQPLSPPIILLLLASSAPFASSSASSRPQKILLSDVQLLTLRGNNALTAHRRVPSIPQLSCISRPAICALHSIDIMRCTNEGSSYGAEDIEWSCKAELPPELRLAATDVICEGFRDADDPYVLRGSCGVEYTLALTELGEQTYPDIARPPAPPQTPASSSSSSSDSDADTADDLAAAAARQRKPIFDDGRGGEDLSAWLFAVIFLAVCAWIIYSAWIARTWTPPPSQAVTRSRRVILGPNNTHIARFNDDSIIDDDDDDDDDRDPHHDPRGPARSAWKQSYAPRGPPPPYSDRRADYISSKRDSHDRRSAAASSHHDPSDYAYPRPRGWTPGFWSGLAGGTAAGYMAGRSSNTNANTNANTNTMVPRTRSRHDDSAAEYRSPWDAGPPVPRPSVAPRPYASSSSSRPEPIHAHSGSGSGTGTGTSSRSERYESTGYGSTRRR